MLLYNIFALILHPITLLNLIISYRASLIAQLVNHLPAVQETRVWSLGQEDPLEKEMATHPSILAWRIPRTEEPDGHSPWDCKSRTQLSN